jgi:TrmH family RNA methyltransferase
VLSEGPPARARSFLKPHRARIRVVLVRPERPDNIGAAARVIRNTGLSGLDLVDPGDWRTIDCWRTAWGGHEVLEEARVFPELRSALAEASWVACLSGRGEEGGVPVMDVREMAAEAAALHEDELGALVFGPEASGLSLDEIALCGRRVRIPSHPAQPSLNLSHAVMVTAYEVFRSGRRTPPGTRRATHDEKSRAISLLQDALVRLGALPARKAGLYSRAWEAMVRRADLTPKELALLEHMARKVLKFRG